MGLENRISTEPACDVESASDDSEGVPSHAAYQLLGQDVSCDEETEAPNGMNGAQRSFASDTPSTQEENSAGYRTHEVTGLSHSLSAAVDCQSAEAQAVDDERPDDNGPGTRLSPKGIDAGTLAATARALDTGCQPINFARWDATDAGAASSEGSHRPKQTSFAPKNRSRAGQDGKSHHQEKNRHRPKVVMMQQGRGPAASLDLTEEKRTAIQGAMKNIDLNYMPQWAAVVPEQAWIKAVKTGESACEKDSSNCSAS